MEIIIVNGTNYSAKNVTTTSKSIAVSLEGDAAEIKSAFENATELTVSSEDGEVYGEYTDLTFESITEYADSTIVVTMHIPSPLELAVSQLQTSQAEQDEAIADLYGGLE